MNALALYKILEGMDDEGIDISKFDVECDCRTGKIAGACYVYKKDGTGRLILYRQREDSTASIPSVLSGPMMDGG